MPVAETNRELRTFSMDEGDAFVLPNRSAESAGQRRFCLVESKKIKEIADSVLDDEAVTMAKSLAIRQPSRSISSPKGCKGGRSAICLEAPLTSRLEAFLFP